MLAALVAVAKGNPIALEPGLELSGENVTVKVYRTESRGEGDYTFSPIPAPPEPPEPQPQISRGVKRNDGFGLDTGRRQSERRAVVYWVQVTFPVILFTNGVPKRNWIDVVKPAGTLDGSEVVFRADPFSVKWSDARVAIWRMTHRMPSDRVDVRHGPPELPEGWAAVFFENIGGQIVAPGMDRTMHISHTHPTFLVECPPTCRSCPTTL